MLQDFVSPDLCRRFPRKRKDAKNFFAPFGSLREIHLHRADRSAFAARAVISNVRPALLRAHAAVAVANHRRISARGTTPVRSAMIIPPRKSTKYGIA
jgi:hypothetical protein